MARRMVSDAQDVFRVVVVRRAWIENPNWVRGVYDGNDRTIPGGEPYEVAYGPYNSLGAARGQKRFHAEPCGRPNPCVISATIQKAETVWSVVE